MHQSKKKEIANIDKQFADIQKEIDAGEKLIDEGYDIARSAMKVNDVSKIKAGDKKIAEGMKVREKTAPKYNALVFERKKLGDVHLEQNIKLMESFF